MVVCKFFMEGYCKFGVRCKFDHVDPYSGYDSQRSSDYSPERPQGTSILKASSTSFGRQEFAPSPPQHGFGQSQQQVFGQPGFSQTLQQPFSQTPQHSFSQTPQQGYNTPQQSSFAQKPPGLKYNVQEMMQIVLRDIAQLEKGSQWQLSCYSPLKELPNIPGLEDYSPEELRWECYKALQNGSLPLCSNTAVKEHTETTPDRSVHQCDPHCSNHEVMPVEFGQGNLSATNEKPKTSFQIPKGEEIERNSAFARSALTARSPPPFLFPTSPTEEVHRLAAAETLGLCEMVDLPGSAPEEAVENRGNLSVLGKEETKNRPKLCPSERRRFTREKKRADGTWLPLSEWRKSKGLPPKSKKNYSTLGLLKEGAGSGISPNQKFIGPVETQKPTRWDVPPAETVAGVTPAVSNTEDSYLKDPLISLKIAIVPVSYPKVKLTVEECMAIKCKLVEIMMNDECPSIVLQIQKSYEDKGTYVVICGNTETKEWLKRVTPSLGPIGSEGCYVSVRDYRDLRITKVLLRTDGIMAGMEAEKILLLIDRQNPGVSTGNWRIIGGKKEDQTLVLAIDGTNARVLKEQGWRLFLGLDRVQLQQKFSINVYFSRGHNRI